MVKKKKEEEVKLVVIDGDMLAYRCAAANEKRTVKVIHNDTLDETVYNTITAFKEAVGEDHVNYTIQPQQEAGLLKFALGAIKRGISTIVEATGCNAYHVVISGDDNFRLELPLPTQYKGNRAESVRPIQLDKCKKYLIKEHNAETSQLKEADDVLVEYGVGGYNEGKYVVQATGDKDARHGPGRIYDFTKDDAKVELIEGYGQLRLIEKETSRKTAKGLPIMDKKIKGEGRVWLYFQAVFGDVVDGYKPCQIAKAKFGELGAYELLKDCKSDKEALEAIVKQYKAWYPEPVTYFAWDRKQHTKDWLEIFQMYMDCAHMQRWDGDRLVVSELLRKLNIEH